MHLTKEKYEEIKQFVDRLNIVRKGMEQGLDDWPIASMIYEYQMSANIINNLLSNVTVASDWVKWSGGECPIENNQKFEVKLESGYTHISEDGSDWTWYHDIGVDCIVAYRLIYN